MVVVVVVWNGASLRVVESGRRGCRGAHTEVDKREAEGDNKCDDTQGLACDGMRLAARLFTPFFGLF